jgi:hypothetical protein
LIVHENGMADDPGTRLSAERDITSWNVIPSNSGVVTLRTRPSIVSSPGNAASSATPSCCPVHRMMRAEQIIETLSSQVRKNVRLSGIVGHRSEERAHGIQFHKY